MIAAVWILSFPVFSNGTLHVNSGVQVTMRDGVKLATDIYMPDGIDGKLPAVLVRTPYNRKKQSATGRLFAERGFVVAIQDVRGKFDSQGAFILSAADTNDGADTMAWIAAQSWSSGKIGTYGCSYLGEDQIEMSKLRVPQHTAMIAQAAGGAYRYAALLEGGASELATTVRWFNTNGSKINPPPPRPTSSSDIHALYSTLPIVDILRKAGAPPTDYEGVLSHGPGDKWWDQFGYVNSAHRFDVPAIHVSSWYDSSVNETLELFKLFGKNAQSARARDNQFVIISPTTHCKSETATAGMMVGERNMGDPTLDYHGMYLRWFDFWLKGEQNEAIRMPKVQVYVMGANRWRHASDWPIPGTHFTTYFLHSDGNANTRSGSGTLSTAAPRRETDDRFTYDPGNPVPTLGGNGPEDQGKVEDRSDVLVYSTPSLKSGIEVTGPLEIVLYVSSNAKDTDFTVKLVDVEPGGKPLNLQEAILRATVTGIKSR